MLDGLDADRSGEMRLACAGAADQDDVVGVFQELAAMELTCERLVDLAAGEVEAGEIAIVLEAGGLEPIGRRSDLPVGRLGLQELRQDWHGGFEGRGALLGQLGMILGVEQHLMGLLRIGAKNEGAAVGELEVGDLQFGALACYSPPIFRPIEWKTFPAMNARGTKTPRP